MVTGAERSAEAALARVRELHTVRHYNAGSVCLNCGHTAPCATLRALEPQPIESVRPEDLPPSVYVREHMSKPSEPESTGGVIPPFITDRIDGHEEDQP
jgi:hypothetical protein